MGAAVYCSYHCPSCITYHIIIQQLHAIAWPKIWFCIVGNSSRSWVTSLGHIVSQHLHSVEAVFIPCFRFDVTVSAYQCRSISKGICAEPFAGTILGCTDWCCDDSTCRRRRCGEKWLHVGVRRCADDCQEWADQMTSNRLWTSRINYAWLCSFVLPFFLLLSWCLQSLNLKPSRWSR